MKSFEVLFKNNQFINQANGKVLHFTPNTIYKIESDDANFTEIDFLQEEYTVLTTAEKKENLIQKYKKHQLAKILDAGSLLYFRISLGKKTIEDETNNYLFKALLKEDLYIKKNEGQEHWDMCECVCEAIALLEGNLGFEFDSIEENSLNKLYASVVSTYFNKKRSIACNAFLDFYYDDLESNGPKLNLDFKRNLIEAKQKALLLKSKL